MLTHFKPLDFYFLVIGLLSLVLGLYMLFRGAIQGLGGNYLFFGGLLFLFGLYRVALFLKTLIREERK